MKKFLSFLLVAMVAFAANAKELAVLADYSEEPILVDTWSVQPYLLSDAGVELAAAGAEEGMKVRFYMTANAEWQLQIFEGHWNGQYAYFGDAAIDADTLAAKGITPVDLSVTPYVELTLTQAMINTAMVQQWWGGTFLGNGDGNIQITKITLNDDITVLEDATVLANYDTANVLVDTWSVQPYLLSDAGVELAEAGAEEGDIVRFHMTANAEWQLQIFEGHWNGQYAFFGDAAIDADTLAAKGITPVDLSVTPYVDLVLTQAMIDAAMVQQWWGGTFLGNGDGNILINKIELIKLREVIITETILANYDTANVLIDTWSVQPYLLSDAGVELAEAEAQEGDKVRFYMTANAEWQLQIFEGHWNGQYAFFGDAAIDADTLAAKGITPVDLSVTPYVELTLTQAMIETAMVQQWWGGTFLGNGDGNILVSKITLYREAAATRDTIFSHQVELDNAYVEYAGGKEVLPEITVYNADSTKTLKLDKDYTVQAFDNTDLGVAQVIITGKGRYIGTVDTVFTIVAKTVTAEMVKVEASVPFYGEAVEPAIEIVCGNDTLVAGTHYTATFANNDAVGTANYSLKFRGKYTGTVEGTFEVVAPLTITAEMIIIGTVESYTGSAIEPMVDVVVWSDTLFTALVAGVDYELIYSNNVNASDTAMLTIKGLGYYTGSVDTLFTIEPMEIVDSMVVLDAERYEFAGFSVRPLVTVTAGENILVEDVDYMVEYANNRQVTKNATATVTFQGNYKGTIVKTFEIYTEETALDNIEAEAGAMKVLRDGVIYIIRNNQMYDILGHLVK